MVGVASEKIDGVLQHRPYDFETFLYGLRRTGQIYDQSFSSDPRDPARQHRERRLFGRFAPYRFCDSRGFAFDHGLSRLGGIVTLGKTRPARGKDQVDIVTLGKHVERFANIAEVIRNYQPFCHFGAHFQQQADQRCAGHVGFMISGVGRR